mgnify:CR=1 FL=1
MSYFVTGATGFIGRFLIGILLKRKGTIHVLVRRGSKDKFEALGFVVKTSTPQELAAFTDAETKRWGDIIKTLGIKPQ